MLSHVSNSLLNGLSLPVHIPVEERLLALSRNQDGKSLEGKLGLELTWSRIQVSGRIPIASGYTWLTRWTVQSEQFAIYATCVFVLLKIAVLIDVLYEDIKSLVGEADSHVMVKLHRQRRTVMANTEQYSRLSNIV